MRFEQLWPQRRAVEPQAYVEELGLGDLTTARLPFTLVNFVSSIDGRATVEGRSGPLGDEGDRALFRALRAEVDAVLVGTGTLEAERYGRLIRDPAVRARRRERGLRAEPLACTVTRRGALAHDIPLFAEPDAEIVVYTGTEIDTSWARARVEVVEMGPGRGSLAAVLEHLRTEHGVRALLCEGGPRLFAALARDRLFDQLFLTVAPKLTGGGDDLAITSGPGLPEPAAMTLEAVLEHDGTLFLRYALAD